MTDTGLAKFNPYVGRSRQPMSVGRKLPGSHLSALSKRDYSESEKLQWFGLPCSQQIKLAFAQFVEHPS